MITAILVLILLVGLALFNNYTNKSFLFPPFVFTVLWVIVLLVYIIFKIVDPTEMDTLHSNTVFLIALVNISFTVGGGYVQMIVPSSKIEIRFSPTRLPQIIGDLILLTSIITLGLLIIKANAMISEVSAQNPYIALRYQLTAKRLTYGILDYFLVFGLFASLYRIYTFNSIRSLGRGDKVKLYLSIFISVLFLILSTGRTYFFFYFITILITIYLKGNLNTKYIRIFSILSIIVFVAVGIVLSKGGDMSSSIIDNLESSFMHFIAYLEGPILAFDRFYNSNFEYTFGLNSLRFFHAVLFKLNIVNSPPFDVVKEFIYVPYPTNVYTAFYQYIMDFGMLGCLIVFFILGLIHTYLFIKSKTSGNHIKMLTAYSYFPLLMVFFQDQYLTLVSFWLQLWFYSFLVLHVLNKNKDGR